ncbi:GNAT family N-acetyltransferase [Deinococcus arenicola]|uniref:GNAT family N-acetyltransferase n=1 Tax=Deinococcus arenicola TaxID=2994950 RepID=A0ABU4DPF2_9DEIO|nr:GNAT family N-acetyltransferase [Deinococcus sp. ZS9-10]MDV6374305.1 GNAT family N-acetyltransferase [Deinococcus sp. ZS9-10]
MPVLSTPRLWLLPLTRPMIIARLEGQDFMLVCGTPDGPLEVFFPAEWPGDPLGAFPFFLTQTDRAGEMPGDFVAVSRADLRAIGQLGSKGKPNAAGELEIGYGLNPSVWGQGLATEAARALVAHLHARPDVQTVTAQTALHNRASERVLEKLGFVRTGKGWDKEDGDLTVWAHRG